MYVCVCVRVRVRVCVCVIVLIAPKFFDECTYTCVFLYFSMDSNHKPLEQPAACTAFEICAMYLQDNGECADIVLHECKFAILPLWEYL